MKVLALSTADVAGGAGKAAYRLCQGLRSQNVETFMQVAIRTGETPYVIGPQGVTSEVARVVKAKIDCLPLKAYPQRNKTDWTPCWFSLRTFTPKMKSADIIHLHWVVDGFLSVDQIAGLRSPLVWTLHDMWPFTGGCHYAGACDSYEKECGRCPQLGSSKAHDLSHKMLTRKAKAWDGIKMTIVTPSQWLADCARKSVLFKDKRVEVIPNGIDTDIYKPMEKSSCRRMLGLPENRALVLFGAVNATGDPRKGFNLLQEALSHLPQDTNIELVVFGADASAKRPALNLPVHCLGKINDDAALAGLYSAADVVVVPSREDNLPNVAMEALACGTPCVAFAVGGIPDMVDHQTNGYLAGADDPMDLTHGIQWVLQRSDRYDFLSKNARLKVESLFSLNKVASRYLGLYRDVLSS